MLDKRGRCLLICFMILCRQIPTRYFVGMKIPQSCFEIAASHWKLFSFSGSPVSSSRRQKYFWSPENRRQMTFTCEHVWTFCIYQSQVDMSKYSLNVGLQFDLSRHLDGQPLQFMMKDRFLTFSFGSSTPLIYKSIQVHPFAIAWKVSKAGNNFRNFSKSNFDWQVVASCASVKKTYFLCWLRTSLLGRWLAEKKFCWLASGLEIVPNLAGPLIIHSRPC